jgi:F-type H+-transporting ATPase subunit b
MDAVIEVLQAAVREIVDAPGTFAIEVVQFVILVAVIKMVAFGSKKRAGMITRMLAERRKRVAAQLGDAEIGHLALADAQGEVARIYAEAEQRVREVEREMRKRSRAEKAAVLAEGEEQAAAAFDAAQTALAREQAEMLRGIREQLVEVVTQSTQQVLEQGFSQADQRAIVQKAIVSGIEDLERVALTT